MFNMRFVRIVVVSKNMIRLALNSHPPMAWIRPRKIDPLITAAVRTYAKDNMADTRSVVRYEDVKRAMKNKDQYIIDLRDPNEVASTGMIPSSINIPVGYLDSALVMTNVDFKRVYKRGKPSKNHDIIFYCRTGQLASTASNRAAKLGFLRAKAYVGGWEDWEKQIILDEKFIKAAKEKILKTEEPDEHK